MLTSVASGSVPWSNGTIYFDQSGCYGNQRVTVGGKVIVNQWQHFVFKRNADGNQEIWVDGEKILEGGGTAEALELLRSQSVLKETTTTVWVVPWTNSQFGTEC